MKNRDINWEILGKSKQQRANDRDIVGVLLENRGIKTKKEKKEFFKPTPPDKISVKSLSLSQKEIDKVIKRIGKAIKENESIVIYGDYDADGVCATAIMWEVLYSYTKYVHPYIPDRFEEGYGANAKSVENLKSQFPNFKLLITVDNGITSHDAINKANELGIDVIVADHHQSEKELPKAHSIVHTTKISGSGIAWILSREIARKVRGQRSPKQNKFATGQAKDKLTSLLELAGIGTIADQLPLLGSNRSFAKFGLEALNKTKRIGLLSLFRQSGIKKGDLGTYEVNFIIAPRINAMGRLEHAIDSLRLLCTKNPKRALKLARYLGRTNTKRQKIVDEVVLHALKIAGETSWKGVVIVAHESYHEGVIGLAASKLVEEFYRPAIVLSKGKDISKASARSISGFDIIDSIRKLDRLTLGGGGHPMAAGFSIKSDKIETFASEFEKISMPLLTDGVLSKSLRVDHELNFENLSMELAKKLKIFEPAGVGNPAPTFATKNVEIIDARTVGKDANHLKLTLSKDRKVISAIAFGKGEVYPELLSVKNIDIAYNLLINVWNGNKNLELKVKDIKFNKKDLRISAKSERKSS